MRRFYQAVVFSTMSLTLYLPASFETIGEWWTRADEERRSCIKVAERKYKRSPLPMKATNLSASSFPGIPSCDGIQHRQSGVSQILARWVNRWAMKAMRFLVFKSFYTTKVIRELEKRTITDEWKEANGILCDMKRLCAHPFLQLWPICVNQERICMAVKL